MIHPSYTELIEKINAGVEPGDEPLVTSRYSIVIAAAKRARQIVDGEEAMNNTSDVVVKPLSQAVAELDEGIVHILSAEEYENERMRLEAEREALETARAQLEAERSAAAKENEQDDSVVIIEDDSEDSGEGDSVIIEEGIE